MSNSATDYNIKTGNAFIKEIDRINETVPKDKYITAYIIENGEELYISRFSHLGYGVIECNLVNATSLLSNPPENNGYCTLPPDKVLLAHISTVRIYFEYIDISEINRKPPFRIGFQPPKD